MYKEVVFVFGSNLAGRHGKGAENMISIANKAGVKVIEVV